MQTQFKPIAAVLLLSGFIAGPAIAATNKSLEASVANLEREVASLKAQARNPNKITTIPPQVVKTNTPVTSATATQHFNLRDYLPFDPDVPGESYVSSGPYVGVNITFAGSNLIINSPSVNTDLQLLNMRKKITTQLNSLLGVDNLQPEHSHLLLSGIIETQASYEHREHETSQSDIDLTNVSLDATILGPTDWILGFIEFSYDGSSPKGSVFQSTSEYRTGNSRLLVNKAFVTIGNLNCSPFYTTFGQFYVPFGTYSSVMVSDPLTKAIGRTKARAIQVAFAQQSKNAFYGAAYIFRGDTYTTANPRINNGGLNLGFKFDTGFFHGNVGGGYIRNIADSGGMQVRNEFQNFEQIEHRVHGYNARASLSIGEHLDLIGEYIGSGVRFATEDMTYNGHGAKPSAYDLEGSFSFQLCDKPSSIGIGYSKSNQALALGLPLTRKYVVFNTSLLRHTLQSLEFRHDREYAESDTATSADHQTSTPTQTGRVDNALTASFDYYF